jgi:uncharacterized protein YchJ
LPIAGLIYLGLLILVKKSLIAMEPGMIDFVVKLKGRRKGTIEIERCHYLQRNKDVMTIGASLYNMLPVQLRDINTLSSYKSEVKKFLLTKQKWLVSDAQLQGMALRVEATPTTQVVRQ